MKFRDLVELTQDNTKSEEELHEAFRLANKIFVGNKIYLTARREREYYEFVSIAKGNLSLDNNCTLIGVAVDLTKANNKTRIVAIDTFYMQYP